MPVAVKCVVGTLFLQTVNRLVQPFNEAMLKALGRYKAGDLSMCANTNL